MSAPLQWKLYPEHYKTTQHVNQQNRMGNVCLGVNISERKSGTEPTKKRKKRELVGFPPPGGANGTVVHRLDAMWILHELQ